MTKRIGTLPEWFPYLDLGCATLAGAIWYAFPGAGPVPLCLALVPWVWRLVRKGRLTRRTAFDLPLLLFVLTAGLGVWAAYDRQVAWPKFWLIVGGILLFYAFVNAESIGVARVWLLAFFGGGLALYFLATHDWDVYPAKIAALTPLGRALQAPLPELPGHRLHPNVAGGIMAMMLPYTGHLAVRVWRAARLAPMPERARSWLALAVALALLAVTSFGLLMTTSRAAWVALGVALLLAGGWMFAGWLNRNSAARRAWTFLGLVGLGLAAVLAVGLAWPGGFLGALADLSGGSTSYGRVDYLRGTPTLVRDYPLIGAGLGGFMMLYSTYVMLLHVGYDVHSHNLLLNVAVEQGLLAVVALGAMGVLFAAAVWRGVLRPGARRPSGQLGAAALCLVIVLVHGMVDDVLYGSRAVLLLFIPLAFAVPWTPRRRAEDSRWLGLAVPMGITALLLLALVLHKPILSLVYANLGAVNQSRAELSVYSWPEWPLQDEVRRSVDLGTATAQFERALDFRPGNATAHRRLGMIALANGEYEAALEHLEPAYEADPRSTTLRQLYGEALIVNGQVEEGAALWEGLNNEQRPLDIRIWWYRHVGDPERAAWAEQAAGGP